MLEHTHRIIQERVNGVDSTRYNTEHTYRVNQEDKHTYLGFEYVSDVYDLHCDYDRRDYLRQPQTSFVLLVNVNRQSYTENK